MYKKEKKLNGYWWMRRKEKGYPSVEIGFVIFNFKRVQLIGRDERFNLEDWELLQRVPHPYEKEEYMGAGAKVKRRNGSDEIGIVVDMEHKKLDQKVGVFWPSDNSRIYWELIDDLEVI